MNIWREQKFQDFFIDEQLNVIETEEISVPGAIGLYENNTIYLKPGVKDFIFFHELGHAYQAIYCSAFHEGIANVFAHLCYDAFDIEPDYASGELTETKSELSVAIRLFRYFIKDYIESIERRQNGKNIRVNGNNGQKRISGKESIAVHETHKVTNINNERPTDNEPMGAEKSEERTKMENGRIIKFPNKSL